MSKMDALRAMREENYEAALKAKGSPSTGRSTRSTAATPPAKRADVARNALVAPPEESAETEALCGHKNMGGRTCTRPQGHSEKSHRYS